MFVKCDTITRIITDLNVPCSSVLKLKRSILLEIDQLREVIKLWLCISIVLWLRQI